MLVESDVMPFGLSGVAHSFGDTGLYDGEIAFAGHCWHLRCGTVARLPRWLAACESAGMSVVVFKRQLEMQRRTQVDFGEVDAQKEI